jgi:hypothetical protein
MYSGEYDVCDVTLLFAGIPKVVGSIPTVARHIFQACPVWIYTQSNITNINFRKNRTNLNNFSGLSSNGSYYFPLMVFLETYPERNMNFECIIIQFIISN